MSCLRNLKLIVYEIFRWKFLVVIRFLGKVYVRNIIWGVIMIQVKIKGKRMNEII